MKDSHHLPASDAAWGLLLHPRASLPQTMAAEHDTAWLQSVFGFSPTT